MDGDESPAEAFSRLVAWADILEPVGFRCITDAGPTTYWHHFASTTSLRSISATTDAANAPVLVVFSESAAAATGLPVGAGHRLTKFRTWALLHYRGDESEAARAIRRTLGRGAA
mgnify:FL=1